MGRGGSTEKKSSKNKMFGSRHLSSLKIVILISSHFWAFSTVALAGPANHFSSPQIKSSWSQQEKSDQNTHHKDFTPPEDSPPKSTQGSGTH